MMPRTRTPVEELVRIADLIQPTHPHVAVSLLALGRHLFKIEQRADEAEARVKELEQKLDEIAGTGWDTAHAGPSVVPFKRPAA